MVNGIIWSSKATQDLKSIITYLRKEWSQASAERFGKRATDTTLFLAEQPLAGKQSEKNKKIRSYLITEQNMIFYKIKRQNLYILRIIDTRQNPNKRL